MQKEEITAIFDQQAATYDQKWNELAPINSALRLRTGAVLAKPSNPPPTSGTAGHGRSIAGTQRRPAKTSS